MGLPRQEYWHGLLAPPPGDLPDPGIEPMSLVLAGRFITTKPRGKPDILRNSHKRGSVPCLPIKTVATPVNCGGICKVNLQTTSYFLNRQTKGVPLVRLWMKVWNPGGSQMALVVKNPPANAGDIRDAGSIPGSGRSPGGGHGNPVQYSCLENPMDRGHWWATVHGVSVSWT